MAIRKFYWLGLVSILALSSCIGKISQNEAQKPFAHYFDFEEEIKRLEKTDPTIQKTITKNGVTETITTKVDWEKELALFVSSDINTNALKDDYDVEVTEEAGNKQVSYTSKSNDLPVKEVQFTFTGEQCTKAYIKRDVANPVYDSWQELTYVPGEMYLVETQQKLQYVTENQLQIKGEFLSNDFAENTWQGKLNLGEHTLPFNFSLTENDGGVEASIFNGDERIEVKDITIKNDSIFIYLPVFDSEIKGKYVAGKSIDGAWFNYAKKDYSIPFTAVANTQNRFVASTKSNTNINGKWEVTFSPEDEDGGCKAVGQFKQTGNVVTGTFITETGDYRYLEGVVRNDTLLLSCFDGAHAFLFKAEVLQKESGGEEMQGQFWSGKHWQEPWIAKRNEDFALTHPDSLTYLKEGYDKLAFTFPDLNGNQVSLTDDRFKGKAVIVQIMGTWCPNCKDETVYLAGLADKYKQEGLEVVALAFEKSEEFEKATKTVTKFINDLNADYDFLIAGTANKKKTGEALPMLNHVISYPTTIFIDREGNVQRIHTGFYGPGTGEHYDNYVENTDKLVAQLLAK